MIFIFIDMIINRWIKKDYFNSNIFLFFLFTISILIFIKIFKNNYYIFLKKIFIIINFLN